MLGIPRVVVWAVASVQVHPANPCEWFSSRLEAVPHTILSLKADDLFVSLWGKEEFTGCELRFETNDSLLGEVAVPDFDAYPGSEMAESGWKLTGGIRADGPGSGIYGIENEAAICVVRWSQPAFIDDDGTFVQSDTFSMTIQCRDRGGGS